MAVINGLIAKAYYDASGGATNATWVALTIIGDVSMNSSRNNSPVKERASDVETTILGQQVLEVTFTMTRRTGNTQYEAFRDAHMDKTVMGVAFMSGVINTTGSEGWQFDALVTDFVIAEPLEEASTVEVTLKPAADTNFVPDFVEVA